MELMPVVNCKTFNMVIKVAPKKDTVVYNNLGLYQVNLKVYIYVYVHKAREKNSTFVSL